MGDSAKAGSKEDGFLLVTLQLKSFLQYSLSILGQHTNPLACGLVVDVHVYGLLHIGSTVSVGALHSPLIVTELKDRLRFIQFLLSQPYNPGIDWVLHASLGNYTVMILSI